MAGSQMSVAQTSRRLIVKFLKAHGYSLENGDYVKHFADITIGLTIMFFKIGKSDISAFDLELFGCSNTVEKLMNKQPLGWPRHLVQVSLAATAFGNPATGWQLRKDHPEDIDFVVTSVEKALLEVGFPLLDSMKSDEDIVRIIRDTRQSPYSRQIVDKLLDDYDRIHSNK